MSQHNSQDNQLSTENGEKPQMLSETYENINEASSDVVSVPVVIHANAGEVFRQGAMPDSRTGLVPILSEAMKEIVVNPQAGDNATQICVEAAVVNQLPQQEELQQFSSYVTVGVNEEENAVENEQTNLPDQEEYQDQGNIQSAGTENENQNNCGYHVEIPTNRAEYQQQECVITADIQCSNEYEDASEKSDTTEDAPFQALSNAPPLRAQAVSISSARGVTIDSPIINGYSKPKMNIVQQILEAFNQSHKKEMHPSEVYEQVQRIFPYYRQLDKRKKKSWMSSIRHALATSRFKGRRCHDDNRKPGIRKGSLWSLNDAFSSEPSGGVKKRTSRNRSSRRKQKLSGRTKRDFSEMENFTNNDIPQSRITSVPVYPSAAAQMTHMQSTFAPGPMVFSSYPTMMSYMQPQPAPNPVYHQHHMQGQPWLPIPQQQPQIQADSNQALAGPKAMQMSQHQVRQVAPAVPGQTGHLNMVNQQQGSQQQVPGPQMQIPPASQMPMQNHLQDLRAVVYQNMNMAGNNNNSAGGMPTLQQQNQAPIVAHPQPCYPANNMPPGQQPRQDNNTKAPFKMPAPSSVASMGSYHQAGHATGNTLQKSSGGYPQGLHYGGSTGLQTTAAAAPTSMNWTYAQPAAAQQYYAPAPQPQQQQQHYGMSVTAANTAPNMPKSIYPAMCLTAQQLQGNNASNKMTPAPFNAGPYQQRGPPNAQFISQFEHSNVSSTAEIKNEMSV